MTAWCHQGAAQSGLLQHGPAHPALSCSTRGLLTSASCIRRCVADRLAFLNLSGMAASELRPRRPASGPPEDERGVKKGAFRAALSGIIYFRSSFPSPLITSGTSQVEFGSEGQTRSSCPLSDGSLTWVERSVVLQTKAFMQAGCT